MQNDIILPSAHSILELLSSNLKRPVDLFTSYPHIAKSEEMARILLKHSGLLFKYFCDEIRFEKDFLRIAIQTFPSALEITSVELRSDKNIAIEACRLNGFVLKFCAPSLQSDFDVVLAAVKQDGYSIKFAHESLRGNLIVLTEAYKTFKSCLHYAPPSVQNDPLVPIKLEMSLKDKFQSNLFDSLTRRRKLTNCSIHCVY